MFKAGADVMAQHMYQEPGDNCYDKEFGWYRSPLSNCNYPAVSVRGGGGSSVEFVQNPNTDEETEDEQKTTTGETSKKKKDDDNKGGTPFGGGTSDGSKDGKTIKAPDWKSPYDPNDPNQGGKVVIKVEPIVLPPPPPVPDFVPYGQLGAIIAAYGYFDPKFYKKYESYLNYVGWHNADALAKKLGLELNNWISGLNATLLESADGQSYVLVFAGTADIPDVLSDINNALGLRDSQYAQALQLAKQLDRLLVGKNLVFIGHSLGGALAAQAAIVTGRYAITYDPAALSANYMENLRWMGYNLNNIDNVYRYIMNGDPVNRYQPGESQGHVINVTNYTNGNAHSIDNMVTNLTDGLVEWRR